jgi:hypothetical protein
VTARAQASVDAPAPPRPPRTATVRAGAPAPSAASATRSSNQGSQSGRKTTCSAPSETAFCQTPASSRSEPTRTTPGRRETADMRSATSTPTRTRRADSQTWRGGGAPQTTCGSAPAAAQSLSRASVNSSSSVTISGPREPAPTVSYGSAPCEAAGWDGGSAGGSADGPTGGSASMTTPSCDVLGTPVAAGIQRAGNSQEARGPVGNLWTTKGVWKTRPPRRLSYMSGS